ncbi:hypothetical protein [Nostoc sp.]
MDADIIKDLIAFAKPFYLNGDFDTYDEFNSVVVPLLTDKLDAKYSKARTKLEKSNQKLLEKYVEYFSVKYQVNIDTVWGLYNDDQT